MIPWKDRGKSTHAMSKRNLVLLSFLLSVGNTFAESLYAPTSATSRFLTSRGMDQLYDKSLQSHLFSSTQRHPDRQGSRVRVECDQVSGTSTECNT